MLCSRCARRLALPPLSRSFSIRLLSSTSPKRIQNPARSPEDPPPATSTSGAQPFSTPFTPSPARSPDFPPESLPGATTPPAVRSSVKAGTLLKGLGYIKGKDGPVAKEDHEYPEWLWGLLDKKEKASGAGDADGQAGDEYGELRICFCILPKSASATDTTKILSPHALYAPQNHCFPTSRWNP